jgi:hypothetical protein
MILQALLLQTILKVAPPGYTKFSVTPIECHGDACSDYQWSTFYGAYVTKESKEDGKERYSVITEEIVTLAQNKLCIDDNLSTVKDCKRSPLFKGFTFIELVSLESAAAIAESGLREDVEVGRGRSGRTKPTDPLADDAGGEGIGPGGEVCLVQVHPAVLVKFKIDPQTFLGANSEALENCFGFGMDMFGRARNMCAYQATKTPDLEHDWVFETFSAYGTGSTCASANNGKTAYRRSLYTAISSDFGARIKKEKKREAKEAKNSPTLPLPPPSKI